ncbi:MAG TPA: hypothetical protein VJN41_02395 [Alphaproteobacteria bacterium]|nr:hypothetical protein [Alphaproteobacteria bacterium]
MSQSRVPTAGESGAPGALPSRFRIAFEESDAGLSQPLARAYAAEDGRKEHEALYALALDPAVAGRSALLRTLMDLRNPHLQRVLAYGMAEKGRNGERALVVVLEKPLGGRLVHDPSLGFQAWREEAVLGRALPALVDALAPLHERGLAHRALRPDNLFYSDAARTTLVAGECVSGPPGASQPPVFEPIEQALADPFGRAEGDPTCDYFALGVTLLSLLKGGVPSAERPTGESNLARLVHGSYRVLLGEIRVSYAMADLLAGLLSDDPARRWGEAEVRRWLAKEPVEPPAPTARARALRPYRFLERDFFEARPLAQALADNWEEARRALETARFGTWLERDLNDPDAASAADAIRAHADASKGARKIGEDETIARICLALDPSAPIRYRQMSALAGGLGPWLAEAARRHDEEAMQTAAQVIACALPVRALEARSDPTAPVDGLAALFRKLDALLHEPGLGFGIERCLYELNPGLSCRSPVVAERAALSVADLLRALEDAAARLGSELNPVDRHVAAFIASRLAIPASGGQAAKGNAGVRLERLAGLRLLALAQVRARKEAPERAGALPQLCAVMVRRLAPALSGFRSKRLRVKMRERLAGAASQGSLADLLNLLLDPDLVRRDTEGFAVAVEELRAILTERRAIERDVEPQRREAHIVGAQISAALSYAVLAASLVASVLGWRP